MTEAEQKRRQAWATKQLTVLVDMGLDLADAERIVMAVLADAPEGADLDTFIPPEPGFSAPEEITAADIQAARAAWYADDTVPPSFKRLLDATEVDNG